MFIKAPYNFVPLNKRVVLPYWGKYVSHDLPFENSQSGELQIVLTAHSPMFVQNGRAQNDKEQTVGKFSEFEGKHFIPGSSLKGMIRSVLEIMSFAQLSNKVNDHRYAVRDLSPAAKTIYLNNFKASEVSAGWLRKTKNGDYIIEDCGQPGRISHRHLDEILGTDFSTYFAEGGRFRRNSDEEKAAQFKYNRFGTRERQQSFEFVKDSAGRQIYEIQPDGKKQGTIVFTGQPGPRKQGRNGRWSGHHLEFIFFPVQEEIVVSEDVMNNFFFAYHEADKNRWSVDWKNWRAKLAKNERIPVFFKKDKEGKVAHFGLSFLYKLPYKHSIKESIEKHQTEKGIDLAEAIFGYIREEKNSVDSLKGRVHIGHAFSNDSQLDEKKQEVLSGPKASYYPNYIRQKVNGNGKTSRYATFMDREPEIAGWKRYPIHSGSEVQSNPLPEGVSKEILSTFVPIKSGATFNFSIRYHNLKSIELGALLSAISFHLTPNTFHSIGMAKPLGYGKCSLTIAGMSEEDQKVHLGKFEAFMDVSLGYATATWYQSAQITELMTMVSEHQNAGNSELSYMQVNVGRGKNHFVEAKKNNEVLNLYSSLQDIQAKQTPTLIKGDAIAKMKNTVQKELEIYSKKRPYQELIQEFSDQQQAVFYQALEDRKATFIQLLQSKRAATKAAEEKAHAAGIAAAEKAKAEKEAEAVAARKAARQATAQTTGLDLSGINPNDRKAFDELKKVIARFAENYHSKKYDALKKEMVATGLLPEAFRSDTIQLVHQVYQSLGTKEQKKWKAPMKKNAAMKKVGEWIGMEEAMALFEELVNNTL